MSTITVPTDTGLKDAVEQSATQGDTVKVKPSGSPYGPLRLTVDTKDLTLTATSGTPTIQVAGGNEDPIAVRADGVTVSDLKFDHSTGRAEFNIETLGSGLIDGVTVENTTITEGYLLPRGAKNLTIKNSEIDAGNTAQSNPPGPNGAAHGIAMLAGGGNTFTNVSISDNVIERASFQGVIIDGTLSNITVEDNEIKNNGLVFGQAGFELKGGDASAVTVNKNNIQGNGSGVVNNGTNQLTAEKNYWGTPTGPSGEGRGSGDSVDTNVDFEPWYAMRPNPPSGAMTEKVELEGSGGSKLALSEEVQKAVDAAESDETVVIVQSDTYDEDVTLGVTGLTLTSAKSARPVTIEPTSTEIAVQANGVEISELTVDGANVGTAIDIDGDSTRVEKVTTEKTSTGISVDGAGNTLFDNDITVNPQAGITLQNGASNTVVEKNLITTAPGSSGGDGVLVKNVSSGNLVVLNDIAETPPADFKNAVRVESGGNPGGVRVHFNDIRGNTNGAVNSASGTLDARSNFWDDRAGPGGGVDDPNTGRTASADGETISADVAYDPFIEINNGFILESGTPSGGRDIGNDGLHEIFEDRTDEENGQPEDDDGDGYHPTDGYLFLRHLRQGHFDRLADIEGKLSQTYTTRFDFIGNGSIEKSDVVTLVLDRTA